MAKLTDRTVRTTAPAATATDRYEDCTSLCILAAADRGFCAFS